MIIIGKGVISNNALVRFLYTREKKTLKAVDLVMSPEERHMKMQRVCLYNQQIADRPNMIEDSHLRGSQHSAGLTLLLLCQRKHITHLLFNGGNLLHLLRLGLPIMPRVMVRFLHLTERTLLL